MNLNTITEVKRPMSADQITQWRDGYAWLRRAVRLRCQAARRPQDVECRSRLKGQRRPAEAGPLVSLGLLGRRGKSARDDP